MIGITGHTSGLGKALFDQLSPDAVGFSRSNGYDINDATARLRIVSAVRDCTVFINNAHSNMGQVDLLYDLQTAWRSTNKLIINISSNSSDGIKSFPHRYAVCKAALDKASEQLSRLPDSCRIVNIRPGYINTDRVSHVHDQPKLDVSTVVDVIQSIVKWPDESYINTITLLPRKLHDTK